MARVPVMIWGESGIGKTYAVKKFAEENKMEVLVVIVGGEDNLSFGGIPIKDNDGRIVLTNRIVAQAQDLIASQKPTVLFLDDFSAGAAQVGSPLFTLIQCRELTGIKLPETWMIVAAGNPPGHEYVAADLPLPIATRMAHVVLEYPTVEEWAAWALQNDIDQSLIAFAKAYPQAFKSNLRPPRAWEHASWLLKTTQDENDREGLVASVLGEEVAKQWRQFTGNASLDLDAVLQNRKLPAKLTVEQMHYAIVGLAAKFAENPIAVVETLLSSKKHSELVVGTWVLILKTYPKKASDLITTNALAKQLDDAYHLVAGEKEVQ